MKSQTRREELEDELKELEKEYRELTREAQRSACLSEINARKQQEVMERIEKIEQQLEEMPAQEA